VGVPRETVEAARERLHGNKSSSMAGDRHWPLSGGILRCGGCGLAMQTHTLRRSNNRVYYYYRCPSTTATRRHTCPSPVAVPAEKMEAAVWRFVVEFESEPGRVLEMLDRAIAKARTQLKMDPEEEIRELQRQLDQMVAMRAAFQQQQAQGLMTIEELRVRLEDLTEQREGLDKQIEARRGRGGELLRLKELRSYYERAAEDEIMQLAVADGDAIRRVRMLEATGPEQRRRYDLLKLKAQTVARDEVKLSGVFGTELVYTAEMVSRRRSQ
jgi:hypothetical protein